MSMSNIVKKQNGATPAWLAIVMILVVAFLAWLVWLMLNPQSVGKPSRDLATPVRNEPPEALYTIVGRIESVGVKKFTMTALADRNFFEEDRKLVVKIDQNTEYVLTLPSDPKTGRLINRQYGSLNDLKVGEMVTVSSETDIINATEFIASRVDIVR